MTRNTEIARLLRGVMLVGAVTITCATSLPTQAQVQAQAAATESEEVPLATVVVTGSRIPVPANITATSPIQVVTSLDFEQQGITDTTNMINRLPQNIVTGNDLGNNSAPLNAPGGIATADLRGLGPQRTLVLVDGRRLGPGDPNTTNPNVASDLDQVPAALIERIDVVTGGASATYGSDAIAGVVNFIMKKNFEGVEVGGEYGLYQHTNHENWVTQDALANGFQTSPSGSATDGENRDWDIIMGTNVADGKGNITAYVTYHEQNPVSGLGRDFADCEFLSNADLGGKPNGITCVGSPNSNQFIANNSPYSVVGHSFLPYPQAGSSPPPQFNSSAYEYLQRGDERYNAGFFSHLDINDYVKPYMDVSFMNDKSTVIVAPSALFEGNNPITADNQYLVNCSNPLLSTQERNIICTPGQVAADTAVPGSSSADINIGRRNIEGGGRINFNEHTNYRIVIGSKGGFGDAWDYDMYGQYAYTSLYNNNGNYLDYAKVNLALQATGTAAAPVCVSGGSCVPYNIFTQGGVTPAQTNYLATPGTGYGQNWEEVEHADLTGDLGKYNIKSPWAKDGIGVNIGAEHRLEALNFAPDGAELSGDLSGFSGAVVAIDRGFTVTEGILEFRAPLAQDMPGIKDLTFDAGYRYSDYTTAGATNTYKFEVQYAPTEDVRLRASYDKAVRAPNLIELYNPQSYGQTSGVGVDLCAPTVGAGGIITSAAKASAAECANTGLSATQYGNGNVAGAKYTGTVPQCNADQCGQITGGNQNLKPESAETYSIGLSITPTMLPNFNASIDYYHINLTNIVTSAPINYVYTQCLATGSPEDCDLIVRNHVTGALSGATVAGGGYIIQTDINGGASLTSGIDVQGNYRYPIGSMGTLLWNFTGTWLQHDTTTPFPGLHTFDCAGLFGDSCSDTVNPKWRHNMRISWELPWTKLMLSAYWRFIGKTSADNNSTDPSLQNVEVGAFDTFDHVPNISYLDLSAIWQATPKLELRAGVNNLFDKDPPIVAQDYNNGTIPSSFTTYDFLGRQIFVGFKAHF